MKIDHADLEAFMVVAGEKSFTRAAAHLGVSQSALSHTVRRLEEAVGLRLLTRTTRSVAATEAGERLLQNIAPKFDEIERALTALGAMKKQPSGTIRINCPEHAASAVLWPKLSKFLLKFPEVKVEVVIDNGLVDIVAERFDAGIRHEELVAKDMIAVRIGPDMRMVVVGAPNYFKTRSVPHHPRDLTAHNCINVRLPTLGGLYVWEFERRGRELKVRVDGQLVLTNLDMRLNAVLAGVGLAYLPEDMVQNLVAKGKLVAVLDDWCAPYAGYHLYYPSRRQHTPAFAALLETLRWRGP